MQRTIRVRSKATGKGTIPTNWVYPRCFVKVVIARMQKIVSQMNII